LCVQLCLATAGLCLVTMISGFPEHRDKRSVLQLCSLFVRHGGEGCLRYNGYGCYCGYGNAGEDKQPTDEVDKCCEKHDKCYGKLKCGMLQFAQAISYKVNCSGPAHWKYKCKCKDKRTENPCARSICDCDLQMARCLQRTTFRPEFEGFDRSKCQVKPRRHHSRCQLDQHSRKHRRSLRRGGRRRKHRRRKHRRRCNRDRNRSKANQVRNSKKTRDRQFKSNVTTVEQSKTKTGQSSYFSNLFSWLG